MSVLSPLPLGIRTAMTQLGYEVVFRKRHLMGLRAARTLRGKHGLWMHLGCGPNRKEGWVNVDLSSAADVTLDAREPFPFENNTFSRIYSEHFYEHFQYPRDITHLLSECHRVMEPGGIHSFGVPDGEVVLKHYTTRDYTDHAAAQLYWNPEWCKTQMDHVNYCMRQNGEHHWYYDEETMRSLLESVGFVDVKRREFDPALDQEKRLVGTLYMQCSKSA